MTTVQWLGGIQVQERWVPENWGGVRWGEGIVIILEKRAEEPYHRTTTGMEWMHRWVGGRRGRRGWARTGPVASPVLS